MAQTSENLNSLLFCSFISLFLLLENYQTNHFTSILRILTQCVLKQRNVFDDVMTFTTSNHIGEIHVFMTPSLNHVTLRDDNVHGTINCI